MSDPTAMTEEEIEKARHPFAEAWEMFRRNHAALVALVILIAIVLMAIIGPALYGRDPYEMIWAPFTAAGRKLGFHPRHRLSGP